MKRLLDRLSRELEWTLLSPAEQCLPEGLACVSDQERERLIPAMQIARGRSFAELGRTIPTVTAEDRWSDWNSWHVIASQKADREIVGAVRVFVLRRRAHPITFVDLLTPCGVEFASPNDRDLHEQAFAELLNNFQNETMLIYVGPLFVSAAWRRSGLAAVLGLGANALFRIHNCHLGLTMATTRDCAASLFSRLGGYRLTVNGRVLPAFRCLGHQEFLEMLGLDPICAEPELQGTVEMLRSQFCRRTTSACDWPVADAMDRSGALGMAASYDRQ